MLNMSADYPCCSIESTNLSCQRIKVVKATVFTIRWVTAHTPHCVKIPGGKNQQRTIGTSLEALSLGLPEGTDRLLLKVYQREALLQTLVFHQSFTTRYARCHDDGKSFQNSPFPLLALAGIIGSFLIRLTSDWMLTMALHLNLACPPQQKQIAEGAIATIADAHMQTTAHHVRQQPAQKSTAGVVVYIGYHGLAVALIKAYRVVIVVVEKRLLIPANKRIVLLPLFL